ncbi:MAG: hypothetical protein ACOYD0_04335 [Candidatus Nanopelagicales bacterium]
MTSSSGVGSSPQGAPVDYSADAADQKLIRTPLLITAAVGIAATIIATVVAGSKGAIAGALGTIVVLAFFGLGQYVVARVLRNNPAIAMNMALLVFVLQMGVLFVLMAILKDATFFASRAFALTVVVCALVWTGAAVWVLMRTKVLYVEPGTGPGVGAAEPPQSHES